MKVFFNNTFLSFQLVFHQSAEGDKDVGILGLYYVFLFSDLELWKKGIVKRKYRNVFPLFS